MGRIQTGYEAKFRNSLRAINARQLEKGVEHLICNARDLARHRNLSLTLAFHKISNELNRKITRFIKNRDVPSLESPPRFLCDVGLGGLARWLRASGYEADWLPHIDDDSLLAEAEKRGAILVTTDAMLMERRILRDKHLPAVWVPPAFGIQAQLGLVLEELRLPLLQPRCMVCGGTLRLVDKESYKDQIPPKTYIWLNEYFRCDACGKLFWHGTHWKRIRSQLDRDNYRKL